MEIFLFFSAWAMCGVRGGVILYRNGGEERIQLLSNIIDRKVVSLAALFIIMLSGPFTLITARPLRIFSVLLGITISIFLLYHVPQLGFWYIPIGYYTMTIPTAISA